MIERIWRDHRPWLGLGLILIGLVVNEFTVASLLSPDGVLSLYNRARIWSFDLLFLVGGGVVLSRRPLTHPGVVMVCSLVVFGIGVLFHLLFGYSGGCEPCHAYGSDDAFITYRYARNLVHGEGLVFNAGEYVEGYSALLYLLLLAPAIFLGDCFAYPFAVLLNFVFMGVAFWLFFHFLKERFGELGGFLGMALLATFPALWLWTTSGMEPPLVVLLQLSVWVVVERVARAPAAENMARFCVLVVLCVLVRADGFITPGIAVVYLFIRGRRRAALQAGGVLVVAMLALASWRLSYYGYPLPNTYYVKVSGPMMERIEVGVRMLFHLVMTSSLGAYLVLIGADLIDNLVRVVKTRSLDEIGFETLFSLGWLSYWVFVGGDHFEERFLIALGPIGVFVFLKFFHPARSHVRVVLTVAALLLVAQFQQVADDSRFAYGAEKYDQWVTLGSFLRVSHPGALIAVDAAGKIPFFSGLRSVDILGLNDEFIAHKEVTDFDRPGHNKYDPEYVLGREPDLIASWIQVEGPDMAYDMTRERYEGAGYRIRYLVNTDARSRPENIVDVANYDEPAILELIGSGYEYAVLEKSSE